MPLLLHLRYLSSLSSTVGCFSLESVEIGNECLSQCTSLTITRTSPPPSPLVECSALKTLNLGDHNMESDTRSTLSLVSNLALERIAVGVHSCTWVDWVELGY